MNKICLHKFKNSSLYNTVLAFYKIEFTWIKHNVKYCDINILIHVVRSVMVVYFMTSFPQRVNRTRIVGVTSGVRCFIHGFLSSDIILV